LPTNTVALTGCDWLAKPKTPDLLTANHAEYADEGQRQKKTQILVGFLFPRVPRISRLKSSSLTGLHATVEKKRFDSLVSVDCSSWCSWEWILR
jgi:hypothetical protein